MSNQEYYQKNKERIKARSSEWKKNNPEKRLENNRRWRALNLEKSRESARKYNHNNKDKVNANTALRNARKLQATPKWADLNKIKIIYHLRGAMNEEFGKWHVDHIVPLQGKNVCGLHVENNLRLIQASANISKGNKWEV